MQTISRHDRAHTPGLDVTDIDITRMSDAERVAEGIKRGIGKLSPAIQAQLKELVTPQALAVAGGFFVAWLFRTRSASDSSIRQRDPTERANVRQPVQTSTHAATQPAS
jgi:hypothetical protein